MKSLALYLESLPQWKNDMKMQHYFASFPPRSVNPHAYDERLGFWKEVIGFAVANALLDSATHTTLTADGLSRKFNRKNCEPIGLATVLSEMKASKEIVELSEYMSEAGVLSWVIGNLVLAPLRWGVTQVLGTKSSPREVSGRFVLMPAVAGIAERIRSIHSEASSSTDHIMTLEQFGSRFSSRASPNSEVPLSGEDISIVVRYLEQRMIISTDYSESIGVIVKFKNPKHQKLLPITDLDRNIVTIKTTIDTLNQQIIQLESKETELTRQAQERVRNHQRVRALFCLKQKKAIQEVLHRRMESLNSLVSIMLKIQGAETDAEIFAAYSVGADALKTVLNQNGLTVERVDDTMGKLRDVLASEQEIEEAIRSGQESLHGTSGIDDDELERELDQLLNQEQATEARRASPQSHLLHALESLPAPSASVPVTEAPSSKRDRLEMPLEAM